MPERVDQGSNGPLGADDAARLQALVREWKPEQLLWASGFLAGLSSGRETAAAPLGRGPAITVIYLSQTGNGQKLARKLGERLTTAGFDARVFDAADYRKARIKQLETLLIVASTHGEGDPPDTAAEFYQFLMGSKAPKLDNLWYSVLALGDSSYAQFCGVGKAIDARLESLGATRLVPRRDCDLDYHEDSKAWSDDLLRVLGDKRGGQVTAVAAAVGGSVTEYTRSNPYLAELLTDICLTGRGSSKEIRHLELSIADSGMVFAPGDSIGVVAPNPRELVDAIMQTLAVSPDTVLSNGAGEITLREALTTRYEIHPLTRPVIQGYAELADAPTLRRLLEPDRGADLEAYLWGRDLLDLLTEFPLPGLDPQLLVGVLRKLPARLYSIASSQAANADEVHLTVATVRYEVRDRARRGVASTWLADDLVEGSPVPIYLDENPNFKLPADPDAPIVMIGPGTGVAPFRAFVEEREALGATGKSWLFFGERHFTTDFLYQREWQAHLKTGNLSRLEVAFSRDQADKVYVQHRMAEHGRELYGWLESGAYLYVCGDAKRMAPDVHAELEHIVAREGGLSPQAAKDYLAGMQRDKRYQRDVY